MQQMKTFQLKKQAVLLSLVFSIFIILPFYAEGADDNTPYCTNVACAEITVKSIKGICLFNCERILREVGYDLKREEEKNKATAIKKKEDELTLELSSSIFNGEEKRVVLNTERNGSEVLKRTVRLFFQILISISGTIAVFMLVFTGISFIYSNLVGNVSKMLDMRGRLIDVAIGIIILLLSYLVLNFINPNILKGDFLNLEKTYSNPDTPSDNPEEPVRSCEEICKGYKDGTTKSKTTCLFGCDASNKR